MAKMITPPTRKRQPRPLSPPRMEELALAYVARFATTAAKLEAYLTRKLRERGWEGEGLPPDLVSGIVGRCVDAGYIDDAAWARARSGSLLRRGFGQRRVSQALGAAGIAEDIRAEVQPDEGAERAAALLLARKRRFGPFGQDAPDRARREKQIAAMLRAGHSLDSARALVNAASSEAAAEWAALGCEEE